MLPLSVWAVGRVREGCWGLKAQRQSWPGCGQGTSCYPMAARAGRGIASLHVVEVWHFLHRSREMGSLLAPGS